MASPKTIIVAKQPSNIKKSFGIMGILKFALRHFYLILILLSLIPIIIYSVDTAIETNNPSYPFVKLGLSVINADAMIYDDVQILKENPTELIGMEKPEVGLVQKLKYFWKVFLVVWKILGYLTLITLPFSIIYRIIKGRNISEPYKNMFKAFWIGLIFILIINLAITSYRAIEGTLVSNFDPTWDIYKKVGYVLFLNLPFHGTFALIKYVITLL